MSWLSNLWAYLKGDDAPASSLPMITFTEAQIMAPVKHIMRHVPANTPQAFREIQRAWNSIAHHLEQTPQPHGHPTPGATSAALSFQVFGNNVLLSNNNTFTTLKDIWDETTRHTQGVEASIAAFEEAESKQSRATVYDLDTFRESRTILRAKAPYDSTAEILKTFLREFRELEKAAHASKNEQTVQQNPMFPRERKHRPY